MQKKKALSLQHSMDSNSLGNLSFCCSFTLLVPAKKNEMQWRQGIYAPVGYRLLQPCTSYSPRRSGNSARACRNVRKEKYFFIQSAYTRFINTTQSHTDRNCDNVLATFHSFRVCHDPQTFLTCNYMSKYSPRAHSLAHTCGWRASA